MELSPESGLRRRLSGEYGVLLEEPKLEILELDESSRLKVGDLVNDEEDLWIRDLESFLFYPEDDGELSDLEEDEEYNMFIESVTMPGSSDLSPTEEIDDNLSNGIFTVIGVNQVTEIGTVRLIDLTQIYGSQTDM